LRFCIRPLNGALVLPAIMDIRAHPAISPAYHCERALAELLAKNQHGLPIAAAKKPLPDNVANLMDPCARGLDFRLAPVQARVRSGSLTNSMERPNGQHPVCLTPGLE
jgi:hypothetical protein